MGAAVEDGEAGRIGGEEDAASGMLGAVQTGKTVGLGRFGGKHCGSGIFPFGKHAAPGVADRHKPGERSALRVCDRSVSVGNEVDDRGA